MKEIEGVVERGGGVGDGVVNVVLLKLPPELYQFRYNSLAINVNQDTNSWRSIPNQWARCHRV